ncbi:uncharacterized protein MONOS_17378 [Monocercomonoides exilis]|uniref:uncharacterized protein n=1 Tax=Monocercomonoides exilis TaxID=2049356 RepID=UPI00355A55E9|nr:hypothetical protein MONOS_17378 [Monocercomonoides exilis]
MVLWLGPISSVSSTFATTRIRPLPIFFLIFDIVLFVGLVIVIIFQQDVTKSNEKFGLPSDVIGIINTAPGLYSIFLI